MCFRQIQQIEAFEVETYSTGSTIFLKMTLMNRKMQVRFCLKHFYEFLLQICKFTWWSKNWFYTNKKYLI